VGEWLAATIAEHVRSVDMKTDKRGTCTSSLFFGTYDVLVGGRVRGTVEIKPGMMTNVEVRK
jgi:hypothetical protein